MNERVEGYRWMNQQRKAEGERNRQTAAADFDRARRLAAHHGLALRQCDEVLYQLRGPSGWIKNLYPGNQRIYAPNPANRGPYFNDLPDPWSLEDIVRAAAKEANHAR